MKTLTVVAAFSAALMLQACGGTPYTAKGVPGYTKSGHPKNPYIKLGRAYTIKGKTYYPKHEPDYDETGVASWYGPNFHGKKTANGEIYDQYAMTAAHKTLPLPSVVRVTHRKNGKSIIVRVNDRGPYAHGRIIDLSKTAAQKINMIGTGVAPVRVEYLPEESKAYLAELIAGKRPDQVDLADVLRDFRYANARQVPTAAPNATRVEPIKVAELSQNAASAPAKKEESFWDILSPITNARAAEPAKPVKTIRTDALPPLGAERVATPAAPVVEAVPAQAKEGRSPYDLLGGKPAAAPEPIGRIPDTAGTLRPIAEKTAIKPVSKQATPAEVLSIAPRYYVQVGAFSQPANVTRIAGLFGGEAAVERTPLTLANGTSITRLRVGPVTSRAAAEKILAKAHANGMRDARLVKEK